MKKAEFIVSVQMPDRITKSEMRSYIESAIRIWRYRGDPDDPLYEMDQEDFKVKHAPRKPAKGKTPCPERTRN